MIKAIIFDCFGVIVGKGFDYTYTQAGGDPKKDRALVDDMLKQANLGIITEDKFNQSMAEHLGKSLSEWHEDLKRAEQADQELLNFISGLRAKYKTALLSNSNKGVLSHKIGGDYLEQCFDEVICSAEVGMLKPSPDIYKLTADRLGVAPSECVFIDDHKSFTVAAEDIGMKAITYTDFDDLKLRLKEVLAVNSES